MKTTIELAREAGFEHDAKDIIWTEDRDGDYTEELKAFEALVRADEREECAKVCEQYKGYGGNLFAPAIRNRGNT